MPVKGLQLLCFVLPLVVADASFAQAPPPGALDRNFDLKRAILSPAPLGPPSRFEPPAVAEAPPVQATTDPAQTTAEKPVPTPALARARTATPQKTVSSKPRQKSAVAARKPKSDLRNSFARDANRQTWPCTGGGICAWTKPR
jgi:hypothetical protein